MTLLNKSEVGEVLQAVYDSEFDVRIESAWDAGYSYYIGTNYSGYGASFHPQSTRIEDVVSELAFRVSHKFPKSDFAGYWRLKVQELISSKRPFAAEALEEAKNLMLVAGYTLN